MQVLCVFVWNEFVLLSMYYKDRTSDHFNQINVPKPFCYGQRQHPSNQVSSQFLYRLERGHKHQSSRVPLACNEASWRTTNGATKNDYVTLRNALLDSQIVI